MINAIISEPNFWLVGVGFGLLIWLSGQRPSGHALAAVGGWAFSTLALNAYRLLKQGNLEDFAFERLQWAAWGTGYSVTLTLAVAFLLGFLVWRPRKGDLLAMVLMMVWLMGEGWTSIMENFNCNFLQVDPGGKAESICGRIYGEWYSYVPLIAQLTLMLWFCWRFAKARKISKS